MISKRFNERGFVKIGDCIGSFTGADGLFLILQKSWALENNHIKTVKINKFINYFSYKHTHTFSETTEKLNSCCISYYSKLILV